MNESQSNPSPVVVNIDAMLSLDEAAAWLGLHRRILIQKTKGRSPIVPAFKLSRQVYRFHPRTILAKMAKDSGVSLEVVAASYGVRAKE